MSRAVSSSTGSRRIATSRITSAITPPKPTSMNGPNCGSSRTPRIISTPVDHLLHQEAVDARACGSCAARRLRHGLGGGAHRRRVAQASVTPPTSVLWLASGETIFTATGKPMRAGLRRRLVRRSWRSALFGTVRPCVGEQLVEGRAGEVVLRARAAPASARRHAATSPHSGRGFAARARFPAGRG